MKRVSFRLDVGIVLLIVAYGVGRIYQHARTGYHYKILAEKEFTSPMGPIHWRCVTESAGFPFLDPEITIIEYGDRTIYKARRSFQERSPFAENIEASDKSIAWDDGEFHFQLKVEPLKNGGQNGATNRSHPESPETNNNSSAAGSHL